MKSSSIKLLSLLLAFMVMMSILGLYYGSPFIIVKTIENKLKEETFQITSSSLEDFLDTESIKVSLVTQFMDQIDFDVMVTLTQYGVGNG